MRVPSLPLQGPQAESVRARARRLRAFASLPIVDVRRLAWDERADFAAFLATLSPRQWQAPTLCARWRVRDVVAHVISYDELDARGLLAHVVRGRFRPDQVNAAALVGYDTRTPEQLLALPTDHLQPRGLPAALGGRVALVEALFITRTSGARSDYRARFRRNGCCPRCAPR